MKNKIVSILLLAVLLNFGSTVVFATEGQPYKNNAGTGFYGSYEESTSSSTTTSTSESSSDEKLVESKRPAGTQTVNTFTVEKAYQEKLPQTGDATYRMQVIWGVMIISIAIYLIKRQQRKEGL